MNSRKLRSPQHVEIPNFLFQNKFDDKTVTNFHSHSGYEIVWIKKGEAKYIFEEKVYDLTENDILLFNSSELHKVSLKNGAAYERIVIMFTNQFLSFEHPLLSQFKRFLADLSMPHFVFHLFTWKVEQLQQLLVMLQREYEQTHLWEQRSGLELYFLELLLFLGREMNDSHKVVSMRPISLNNNVTTQERILREINTIWNTDWRLEALAESLHFNKYYLCHFFKKEFGVTIHQYILQRRIYEAKKMLINTNLSIQELAIQVGFSSASNFIRSFKKHVHMTPKQYRESSYLHAAEF